MVRYIATAAAAGLLLAVAVRSRQPAEEPAPLHLPEETVAVERPDHVEIREVEGERRVVVRHRVPGRLSRASLVYEIDGERRTVDSTGSCDDALERARKLRQDGDGEEIHLTGPVEERASRAWLVLEDETGTRALPVRWTPLG